MVRNNYTDGRPFIASDWNTFANLSNKEKIVFNTLATKLSLSDTTQPDVNTKTSSDALTTAPGQLDVLLTDINTKIDSLGEPSLNFAVNNALNITELETLSWYDSSHQVGNKLLYLNNEQRIIDNTYIEPTEITNQVLNITDTNKDYVLNGEIRYADLTKSYLTTSNQYAEYNLPSGSLIVSTPLTQRTASNFDTSFDTDENWEDINCDFFGNKAAYDGINVINYSYSYIEFQQGVLNDIDDRRLIHNYLSVIVDVYLPNGSLISSTQYNHAIVDDNDLLISATGVPTEANVSTNILINRDANSTIDSQNRLVFGICISANPFWDIKLNDFKDKRNIISNYGSIMVVSKTGIVSSTTRTFANASITVGSSSASIDFEVDNSSVVPKPLFAQNELGTVFVIAGGIESSSEKYVNDDLDDADSIAQSELLVYNIDNLGVITAINSENVDSRKQVNPLSDITLFNSVDNATPYVYVSIRARTEEDSDLVGSNPREENKTRLWRIGMSGIDIIDSQNDFDEEIKFFAYELKLSPNYDTNIGEVHWRQRRRDALGVSNYFYSTTSIEYSVATDSSILIKDGRISDGIDWYGVEYTYTRQEDTPDFIRMNRQNKYANIEHNGIKETGVDSGKSSGNTFKLYHSLPVGTSVDIIPNN